MVSEDERKQKFSLELRSKYKKFTLLKNTSDLDEIALVCILNYK